MKFVCLGSSQNRIKIMLFLFIFLISCTKCFSQKTQINNDSTDSYVLLKSIRELFCLKETSVDKAKIQKQLCDIFPKGQDRPSTLAKLLAYAKIAKFSSGQRYDLEIYDTGVSMSVKKIFRAESEGGRYILDMEVAFIFNSQGKLSNIVIDETSYPYSIFQ